MQRGDFFAGSDKNKAARLGARHEGEILGPHRRWAVQVNVFLAHQILQKPVRVEVTPPTTVPRKIEQRVFMVPRLDKRKLLAHLLKTQKGTKTVLIFARTKRRADTIVRHLKKISINVAAIHSNKTQASRQR